MAGDQDSNWGEHGIFQDTGYIPLSTVKRQISYGDLSRKELVDILAYMQAELEAREAVIVTLKTDTSCAESQTSSADPFQALARDEGMCAEEGTESGTLGALYDRQLDRLEQLIGAQKAVQARMREHLAKLERRCTKVTDELEEEQKKHERDFAQGDDVMVMLEKDRERLKSEVEHERVQRRRLEKEVSRVTSSLEEEHALSNQQRHVALLLIRDRRHLSQEVERVRSEVVTLERVLSDVRMAEGDVDQLQKRLQKELELRHLAEAERDRLQNLLTRSKPWNPQPPAQTPVTTVTGPTNRQRSSGPVRRSPESRVPAPVRPPAVDGRWQPRRPVIGPVPPVGVKGNHAHVCVKGK